MCSRAVAAVFPHAPHTSNQFFVFPIFSFFLVFFRLVCVFVIVLLRRCRQPGNIFVKNGQYKLGDFGLVTPVHEGSGADVVEGDCRYMCKELLNDDHSNLTKVP